MTQYVAAALLVAVIAVGGYALWQKIQMQIIEAELQRTTIERDAAQASVRTLETSAEIMMEQVRQSEIKAAEMEKKRAHDRKLIEYTRSLFADHDLQLLMQKKPGLIQRRMQDATDSVFSDLTAATQ